MGARDAALQHHQKQDRHREGDEEALAWYPARAVELARILDRAGCDDEAFDTTSAGPPEVAAAIRASIGW